MQPVIVPIKTLQEFTRIFAQKRGMDVTVKLVLAQNQITFQGSGVELVSRLVEGQYPDYAQIIPRGARTEAVVVKKDLVQAIKAASLFSKTGVYDVHLTLNPDANTITIESGNTQFGNYINNINASIKGNEVRVSFNYRYILEGLQSVNTSEVELRLVDGVNPAIIVPKGNMQHLYIIMPIKQD